MTMSTILKLSDALEVLSKVCKTAESVHSPVCVQNRGQWNNLNHIEIFNFSDHLVKNVAIRIMDLPDDCWWENPGNSDRQVLIISYLEPRNQTEHELMYAYCGCDMDVQLHISWEDWLGIKHSDTKYLHLKGL